MRTNQLLAIVSISFIDCACGLPGWSQVHRGPSGQAHNRSQAQPHYHRQSGSSSLYYRGLGFSGQPLRQPVQHGVTVAAPYFPVDYRTGFYGGGYFGGGFYADPWLNPIYGGPVVTAPGLSFYSPGVYGSFGIVGTPGLYVPQPDYDLARQPQHAAAPLEEAWRVNQERWGRNLPDVPPDPVTRPAVPSSAAARLKSLEAQSRGDEHLRKQEWQLAYLDYKQAVAAADDRGEAHLRLGLVLLELRHYDSAATSFKRALQVQPDIVRTGPSLTELFGPDSSLVRSSLAHKLVEHVQVDIRDPERLFLLGVMLHLDGDPRARDVFESGLRLAGRGSHFTAFLTPAPVAQAPAEQGPELPPAPLPAN